MKNQLNIARFWLIIFGLVVLIPNLGLITASNESDLQEKRALSEFPAFDLDTITAFTNGFNKFYADRFLGRSISIENTSRIKYYLFGSATTEKLIKGKDGYLFFNENQMSQDFRGQLKLDTNAALRLFEGMTNFKNSFADSVDFVWLMAPNKSSIYADKLPSRIFRTFEKTQLEQLTSFAAQLNCDFYLDPSASFSEHKTDSLYFLQDTHWNFEGALLALEKVFQKAEINWEVPAVQWTRKNQRGDLAVLSGISSLEENIKQPVSSVISKSVDAGLPEGWEYYVNTGALKDMTVLLMGDSFRVYLRDWLKMICKEVYVVPNHVIREEVVSKIQPDLVIYQMVERNIANLFGIFEHP